MVTRVGVGLGIWVRLGIRLGTVTSDCQGIEGREVFVSHDTAKDPVAR